MLVLPGARLSYTAGAENEVLVVECKSYLDSRGVLFSVFTDGAKPSERYKLFAKAKIREIVLGRLQRQLVERGFCPPSPRIVLCLAAGNIASDKAGRNRAALKELFAKNGWRLFDEDWLFERLTSLADAGYENDVGIMVAKLYSRRANGMRSRKPDLWRYRFIGVLGAFGWHSCRCLAAASRY